MRKVWRKGNIPEDWKRSILVPLYKRGDKNKVRNYRGISLLYAAYKIYAELMRRRLEVKVEEKEILVESQANVRRGRPTMDNIYILDHLV